MFCCVSSIIYQVVCGGMAAMMAPTSYDPGPAPVVAPGTPTAPAAPAAPAAGGGGTCGRAAECCSAYLSAMGAAGTVDCTMYQNMPAAAEGGCQSAIDGWRSGLQALGREVPAACQ